MNEAAIYFTQRYILVVSGDVSWLHEWMSAYAFVHLAHLFDYSYQLIPKLLALDAFLYPAD